MDPQGLQRRGAGLPRGKIVALRVLRAQRLRLGPPDPGAHPWVQAAWREAGSARFAWRMRYGLAPTDPRYLEATDEVILQDLLAMRFHDQARWAAANPEAAAELAAKDEGVVNAMMALKRKLVGSQDFLASVRRGIKAHRENRDGHAPTPVERLVLNKEGR